MRPFSRPASRLGLALCALLAGCAHSDPATLYGAETPKLDLQQYFNGTLDGYGIVQDRSGKVLRRFTVVMQATWQGDRGQLDERFVWSDGERQHRVWTLRPGPTAGTWVGTAPDVVGEAIGQSGGNALHWRYVLKLPVKNRVYDIAFDDWMYLIDEQIMINRVKMSKFGFKVGELVISFRKRPAGEVGNSGVAVDAEVAAPGTAPATVRP